MLERKDLLAHDAVGGALSREAGDAERRVLNRGGRDGGGGSEGGGEELHFDGLNEDSGEVSEVWIGWTVGELI